MANPRPAISGVNHVNLYTNNLEENVSFYGEVLGLKLVMAIVDDYLTGETEMKNDEGVVINKQGGLVKPKLYVFEVNSAQYIAFFDQGKDFDGPHGGFHHLAFSFDTDADLKAAVASLHAHGVQTSAILDHGPFRSCYFLDPEGRNIEFTCQQRALGRTGDFTDPTPLPLAKKALTTAES
ncbi:VOC family protein [Streptomyces sp. NPDC085932]|uniref:VOC family protein n=1 Tax=Streptomyces sp. NPDC085932 TaxID=3365741 RepID=UPI0037D2A354